MSTEELTNCVTKLTLRDSTTDPETESIVTKKPTDPERAHIWKSKTWRACKEGRFSNLQSDLAKWSPQEVSRFVNARDRNGNTALIVASAATHAHRTCAAIIPILLAAGADVNTKNLDGRTALMEASLWGGLAAVEALLNPKQGDPANSQLRDNWSLKAVDLAGADASLVVERKRRCADGENVEKNLDDKSRASIITLLQGVRDEGKVSTSTRHKHTRNSVEKRDENTKKSMKKLNAVLSKTHAKLKKVDDLAAKRLSDLQEMQSKLAKTEDELKEAESRNSKVQADLNDAFRFYGTLNRRATEETDESPRFRETRMPENPLWIKFDFIRTFNVWPRWKDATVAYMKIDEKHYFAQNGKDDRVQDGFVSGSEYTGKAIKLFRSLGVEHDVTYFQHAEPQLMALFIAHFLNTTGLEMEQFVKHQPIHPGTKPYKPGVVKIFSSREPCGKCKDLSRIANLATKVYDFNFSLIYAKY